MCKLWGSEAAWRIVDQTMQIRGGRAYETAPSLQARGEDPVPVERFMRDSRINMIFEGSSEIMRLLIAREALDPHLKVAGGVLNSQLPYGRRLIDAISATAFYSAWYPRLWMPFDDGLPKDIEPALRPGLTYVAASSRKLARTLFHAMVRYGPKLEKKQLFLGRIVNIGSALFAITAASLRADELIKQDNGQISGREMLKLVEFIVRQAQLRIRLQFDEIKHHNDRRSYSLAEDILQDRLTWLEDPLSEAI